MSDSVLVTLFPQRPVGGPIDFDILLSGMKVFGQIHREDPEFAEAEKAIEMHTPQWTMAGPTAPVLEMPIDRVRELARRPWK